MSATPAFDTVPECFVNVPVVEIREESSESALIIPAVRPTAGASQFKSSILALKGLLRSSPFKARIEDLNWLAPAVGLTAGMINADSELSSRISTTGTFTKHSGTVSNAGLALMV